MANKTQMLAKENLMKVNQTLKLLGEGDKNVKLTKCTDAVLVIGNTGSGKTTFTHFVAGDDSKLISKEIEEDTGEFLIIDENNKISANSTILSQTIFPDLIVNERTHTAYYDCPGFSDTRNTATDIASAYFIHNVINHVKNIKFLFIVNYSSVKEGVDRSDFVDLLRHSVDFIKNVKAFKNSIALVVTKVDQQFIKRKGNMILVPDSKVINNVARFLENVKRSMQSTAANDKKMFYEKAILLIDIFLLKDNDNYSRIGLFRRPDEEGPLSKISLLQEEKRTIIDMIDNKLSFTANEYLDFGYSISHESKNDIINIVDTINEQITINIINITQQIKGYYAEYEKQFSRIDIPRETFTKAYEVLLTSVKVMGMQLTATEVLKTILECVKVLNINVSTMILEDILRLDRYMDFLKMINTGDVKNRSIEWIKPLEAAVISLENSKEWYNFLINLYDRLSKYDVHENKSRYKITELQEKLKRMQQQKIRITGSELKEFLNLLYINDIKQGLLIPGYDNIKNVEINETKLKSLNKVLAATFGDAIRTKCTNSDELTISGSYIKISDVLIHTSKSLCSKKIKSLIIFASNKIFIDRDFVEVDSKLRFIIIAPIWEIIGDRKITLDGAPAIEYVSKKAKDGVSPKKQNFSGHGLNGEKGLDGLPGRPGGSAGSFMGIGDIFINEYRLKITANGGNGGAGQDGGDGGDGAKGIDASWDRTTPSDHVERSDSHIYFFIFYNRETERLVKKSGKGGTGSDGGDGGAGGYGGNEGDITILSLSGQSKIQTERIKGKQGPSGKGGKKGIGGMDGDICIGDLALHFFPLLIPIGSSIKNQVCGIRNENQASSGKNGLDGYNWKKLDRPDEALKIEEPVYIVNHYKNYLRENMRAPLSQQVFTFFDRLNNNYEIKQLYDTLSLIDEFQGMENQYYRLNNYVQFLPFYKSLLLRVEEYARFPKYNEKSIAHKNVLGHLYAAILSKTYSLNESSNNGVVIYIKEYLNLISSNIEEIVETSNGLIVREYNTNYKATIDFKITEAADFLDRYVIQQINVINKQINDEVNSLLELATRKQEAIENIIILKKKKQSQQTINGLKIVNGILNGISHVFEVLRPLASVATSIVNIVKMVPDTFNLADDTEEESATSIFDKLQDLSVAADRAIQKINEKKSEIGTDKSANDTSDINNYKIEELTNNLNHLKYYEFKIYNTTMPMLHNIKNDVDSLINNSKNMSQVAFDLFKWEIQKSLREISANTRHVVQNIEAPENVMNLLERLDEAIDILINIYDRIETYKDEKTLADYIMNVYSANSHNIMPSDHKLRDALSSLEFSIKANVVLDQYEKVMWSLIQFIFPFAEFYLADLSPPSFIKVNETLQDLTLNTVRQIKNLQKKLIESEASINRHDKYIHNVYFYSDNASVGPFYVWKNEEYKGDIESLLSGQEILLSADITKSGSKNAVKFNQIEISFKAHDSALQKELNEKLKDFEVTLTHMGNSYYKCGEKYYIITTDSQSIRYSFAKSYNNVPLNKNVVFDKLKNAPCMLSPYAMWSIKLSNISKTNFSALQNYSDRVDLELVGRGQYILPDVNVCNNNLGSYYKEGAMSDIDNLYEHLKLEETESRNVSDMRNLKLEETESRNVSDMRNRRNVAIFDYYDFSRDSISYESEESHLQMTNGASSSRGDGHIINNVFHWLSEHLRSLKSYNPLHYMSQWFTRETDKNPFIVSNQISNIFMSEKPRNIDDAAFNVNSNLMLANVIIRKYVTGKTYDIKNIKNDYCDKDEEYAHSLAYNYYCPVKHDQNVELNHDVKMEQDKDTSINALSTNDYINGINTQNYLSLQEDSYDTFLIS